MELLFFSEFWILPKMRVISVTLLSSSSVRLSVIFCRIFLVLQVSWCWWAHGPHAQTGERSSPCRHSDLYIITIYYLTTYTTTFPLFFIQLTLTELTFTSPSYCPLRNSHYLTYFNITLASSAYLTLLSAKFHGFTPLPFLLYPFTLSPPLLYTTDPPDSLPSLHFITILLYWT